MRGEEKLKPYYEKLLAGLAERGHAVRTTPHLRDRVADEVAGDNAFHIIDHGTLRHPRALNTGIAYLYPFWNLDPWGIRALSSIGARPFDPAMVPADEARAFADRLRTQLVAARTSRYAQPQGRSALPPHAIAVFLQAEAHRGLAETCHLSMRQMVRALVARDDPRPILIKPHPKDTDPATRRFLSRLGDPRVQVVDANIHDILAVADVSVTINSAVGIESMLHGVPVVLCGQADFHHAAVTVRRASDLDSSLEDATARFWNHDAFLHWYFAGNCLNAGKPSLVDDFLGKVASHLAGA